MKETERQVHPSMKWYVCVAVTLLCAAFGACFTACGQKQNARGLTRMAATDSVAPSLHRTIVVNEQTWADYCNLLRSLPLEDAQKSIRQTMDGASKDKKTFLRLADLAEQYLYNPNSPVRDEELYIPVLESLIASPTLDDVEKIRPKARLELAQKNRLGTKALDFTYTLANGARGTLYEVNTDYVLLFINNPGCHACSETIGQLKHAALVTRLVGEKRLSVLSLYPDEELDEWRRHLSEFPAEWINGYDAKLVLRNQQLYDLKAIPTLYLLDKEKTVLLKDATVQEVVGELVHLFPEYKEGKDSTDVWTLP